MIAAFAKAIQQLPEPAFLSVVKRSLVLAVLVFVVLAAAVFWATSGVGDLTIFGWTILTSEFVRGAVTTISVVAALFAFPVVASIFIGVFVEDVTAAVERRHYASDPPGRSMPVLPSIVAGLRFTGVLILLNVLAIPAYLVLLLIPPGTIFLFYVLNGYLISREYFELVAHRHLDENAARELRKSHTWQLLGSGVVITFLFTIPVVNFVAPLVAAAAMTHIFKAMKAPARAPANI
jgi:uncharacterized protein involved in cysteine biosynthesis